MRTAVLLILGVIALPCFSMTKVDLYRSQVPLAADSLNPEKDAQVVALKNVIVKATGDENAVNNPVIKKALGNTGGYVSDVGYVNLDSGRALKVGFNSKHIRTLITQSQLPFWPPDRTTILVWFITDRNYQRAVMWENTENDDVRSLLSMARQRGLPLTIPVGDIDDITRVEVSDLWGGFVTAIGQASMRYTPDAVLVVKAPQDGPLSWTLYDQTPEQMAEQSGTPVYGQASGDGALTKLVNDITRYYAHKHSIVIAGESALAVYIKVSNLDSALDFFKLETRLKQLSSVASVEVQDARAHDVMYKVNLLATRDEFETEIGKIRELSKEDYVAEDRLMPESDEMANSANTSDNSPLADDDSAIILGNFPQAETSTKSDETADMNRRAAQEQHATSVEHAVQTTTDDDASSPFVESVTETNEDAASPSVDIPEEDIFYYRWGKPSVRAE